MNSTRLKCLLVQPDTQKLWQYNQPETLRYIVVDEFHTFDGAQGIDFTCLLRRLKHRLNIPSNHLACVEGTFATLGSNASQADMLHYATTIFQEPFHEGALIEEDRLTAAEFLQGVLLDVLPVPELEAITQLNPESYASLLATQLMSRVRNAFQVEVPLRNLFEAPTLASLAKHIETLSWATQGFQVSDSPVVGREEMEF